jgi:hypothetical protein
MTELTGLPQSAVIYAPVDKAAGQLPYLLVMFDGKQITAIPFSTEAEARSALAERAAAVKVFKRLHDPLDLR